MAKLFNKVYPGEMVTSNFMNSVMEAIEKLDDRVTKLETAPPDTKVDIENLDPPVGPYRLGQKLTITGKNFEFMIGGLRVNIGGVQVTSFIEGSDTKLVFNIPENIPNVTESGKDVLLTVNNRTSSELIVITLKPKLISLTGQVQVIYQSVEPATVPEDQDVDFRYLLKTNINIPATFVITPTISDNTTPGWQTQVLNESKTPIENRQIAMGTNEQKVFYIRVKVPVLPSDSKAFKLTVTATAGIVTHSDMRTFTAGQQSELQDESFLLTPKGAKLETGENILSADKTTITLSPNQVGYVELTASQFTIIGTYNVSVSVGTDTTDWIATFDGTGTLTSYPVAENNKSQARFPVFKLIAGNNPSDPGEVTFTMWRIESNPENKKRSVTFTLKRK